MFDSTTCKYDDAGSYCYTHNVDHDEPKHKTIQVLVQLTITVDVDSYRLNYGNDDIATIRKDVKAAVASAVVDGSILAESLVDVKQW